MTAYSTIGACCRVGDGTHAKIARQNAGVPYISAKNLKGGQIDQANVMFISENDYNRHFSLDAKALVRPKKGDILFSIIGSLGNQYLYQEGDRFGISSSVAIIRPDQSRIFPEFLFFWVQSVQFQQYVTTIKSGSAQSFLSLEMIRSLPAPAMPLEQQIRVASILSTYEDLIKTNRRRVAVLEEMVRGLFEEWFVRFRFPGHGNVPIIDTADGPLPEEWKRVKVSNVFSLGRGRSYRSSELADDGGMPFVNLKCIVRDGGFKASGLKRFIGEYKKDHIVTRGDIVMAVTDMTQERRIVGRVGRIPLLDEPEAIISMDLVKVQPSHKIDLAFLYCWLRYSDFGPRAAQHANGANVLHLSPKAVADLPFNLPDATTMQRFGAVAEPLLCFAEVLASANQRIAASRDLLLPRLISGQLSVARAERELEEVA